MAVVAVLNSKEREMAKKETKAKQTYDEAAGRKKVPVGLRLDPDVLERLRNVVFWLGRGLNVNGVVEEASVKALEKLEAEYVKLHGKPVPPRTGPVPRGKA